MLVRLLRTLAPLLRPGAQGALVPEAGAVVQRRLRVRIWAFSRAAGAELRPSVCTVELGCLWGLPSSDCMVGDSDTLSFCLSECLTPWAGVLASELLTLCLGVWLLSHPPNPQSPGL